MGTKSCDVFLRSLDLKGSFMDIKRNRTLLKLQDGYFLRFHVAFFFFAALRFLGAAFFARFVFVFFGAFSPMDGRTLFTSFGTSVISIDVCFATAAVYFTVSVVSATLCPTT